MHPDGDELIVVLAGALDVMIDDGSSETAIALDAGHAAVVPRGMLAPARHARTRATLVHQHPNVDAEPSPPRRNGHPVMAIDFDQIDIVAHDMAATLAFYRAARRPDPR